VFVGGLKFGLKQVLVSVSLNKNVVRCYV